MPAVVDELGDVGDVGVFLVTVADNVEVLVYNLAVIERLNQVKVEGGRGLDVDVVLQGLLEYEGEMRTLGAVAVVVIALIVNLCHGDIEHSLRSLYLRGDTISSAVCRTVR